MGIHEEKVIKSIKQKLNDSDFGSSIVFGTEQRYIGALRNGGVNNLEEQYIIGTNTYSSTKIDNDGNKIITKSFYTDNSDNYYKLTTKIIAAQDLKNEDYALNVDTNTFKSLGSKESIDDKTHTKIAGTETLKKYVCYNNGSDEATYEFEIIGDTLRIYPISATPILEENLVYMANSTEIPVASKKTSKRIGKGGIEIVQEKITNNLPKN